MMSSLGGVAQRGELPAQVFTFGHRGREMFHQLVGAAVGLTCQPAGLVVGGDPGRCIGGDGLLRGAAQQRHRRRTSFPSQRVVVAQQLCDGKGFLLGPAAQLAQRRAVRAAAGGEFFLSDTQISEALVDKVDQALRSIFGHSHSREAISPPLGCPHSVRDCRQMSAPIPRVDL
jgi:hypothetical protein